MEGNYFLSRLEKAKEDLIQKRKDPERSHEHKKSKKHKHQRRSNSRSRSEKKKRSRSREREVDKKHKKQHKHRESREKQRQKYKDNRQIRDNRDNRDIRDHRARNTRENSDNRDNQDNRDYRDNRDTRSYKDFKDYRDNRDQRDSRNRDNFERRQRGGFGGRGDHFNNRKQNRVVQEKDPYFQQRRDIERIRKTNPQKAQNMEDELQKKIILDSKQKQIEQAKQKFRQAQKEMQEAKRQDHTILVYCLPLKAKQKDIWNFFSNANSGKIRDIRIIRDARSGRSKGVAYVQFYTSDAVQKALTMSDRPFELKGRQFMGLRVQHSQAEKNRAAAAAKQMRVIKPADPIEQQQQTLRRQTKVLVGGLTDKLSEIQQSELKQLFEPFGQIQYVDIHRDPQTGMCKGFAFIQYVDTEKAKIAVKEMDGLLIRKQAISVKIMNLTQKGQISAHQDFLYSAGSKLNLMNKLSQTTGAPSYSNLQRPPISTVTTPYLIMTNMFKMQGTTPGFFQELKRQVQAQCDQFGVVQRIFIEKNNQGNIWIKYSDTASASKSQDALNGKFFDGIKVFCYFVTQNTYQTRVGI